MKCGCVSVGGGFMLLPCDDHLVESVRGEITRAIAAGRTVQARVRSRYLVRLVTKILPSTNRMAEARR